MFKALNPATESLDASLESFDIATYESGTESVMMTEDMLDIEAELASLESLADTVDNLEELAVTIASSGLTKPLLKFADSKGYLSASVKAIPSVENLKRDYVAGSKEAIAAAEGIVDKVKDMAAGFFTKAWDFVKNLLSKAGAFIKKIAEKIWGGIKWTAGKVWDGAKAAGRTMKAHPIATGIAAATAVVGLPMLIEKVFAEATPGALADFNKFTAGIGKTIKEWMVGKQMMVPAHTDEKNVLHHATMVQTGGVWGSVKDGSASALGYTQQKWGQFSTAVKGAFKEGGIVPKILAAIQRGASKFLDFFRGKKVDASAIKFVDGKAVKGEGDVRVGGIVRGAWWVLKTIWGLIRTVFGGAGSVIMSIFNSAKGLFKGGEGAAAPAAAGA